jgi:hypothetical protein
MGTKKDRRNTGRILFPVQREAMVSPSAVSNALVRLERSRSSIADTTRHASTLDKIGAPRYLTV